MSQQETSAVLTLTQAYKEELETLEKIAINTSFGNPNNFVSEIIQLQEEIMRIEKQFIELKSKLKEYQVETRAEYSTLRDHWLKMPPQQQYGLWQALTANEQQKLFHTLNHEQQLSLLTSLSDEEKQELGVHSI